MMVNKWWKFSASVLVSAGLLAACGESGSDPEHEHELNEENESVENENEADENEPDENENEADENEEDEDN